MKKQIAAGLSLILTVGLLAGCAIKPGDAKTEKELEEMYAEDFEVDGNSAWSLDRDLEFEVWWDKDGYDIWPDIDMPFTGKYYIRDSYGGAVCQFWGSKYRKCIERYDFTKVDYGRDGDDEDKCFPSQVYIYIEKGASEEEPEDVVSLLSDLRDICKKEEKYHDGDHMDELKYLANIWFIDSESEEYLEAADIMITKDTKDKELDITKLETKKDKYDPRRISQSNGNASIYVG